MRHLPARRLLLALVAGLMAAGAAGGIAYATGAVGASGSSTVTVCVNGAGAARFVDNATQCKKGEHAVLLQAAVTPQPTTFTVDCGAGQTISAVLDQVAGGTVPVTIDVKGTCDEDVSLNRDNVTFNAASADAGIRGLGLFEARGVQIHGLAFGTGGLHASGAVFHANSVHIAGGQQGLVLQNGSVGDVGDTTIENAAQNGAFVDDTSTLVFNGGELTGNGLNGITVKGHASLQGVEITGNGSGVEVQFGGSADLANCTVEHSTFTGVHTFDGAQANLVGSTVQFNAAGVTAQGADANVQNSVVRENGFAGIVGLNGARLTLQGGTVVESNHGTGLSLQTGSSVEIQGADVIRQNDGNGVLVQDNSVVSSSSAAQIVDNGGWGFWCEPSPATAVVRGFGGVGTVTGNGAGQIGCPVIS